MFMWKYRAKASGEHIFLVYNAHSHSLAPRLPFIFISVRFGRFVWHDETCDRDRHHYVCMYLRCIGELMFKQTDIWFFSLSLQRIRVWGAWLVMVVVLVVYNLCHIYGTCKCLLHFYYVNSFQFLL